jgi:hypothetical protein
MSSQFEQEVLHTLRELRLMLQAKRVEITRQPERRSGVKGHLRALGGDEYLRVELGEHTPTDIVVPEQLERTARSLRTLARLASVTALPEISAAEVAASPTTAITDRISVFLTALAQQSNADNAMLLLRGSVVAQHCTVTPRWVARLPLIAAHVHANRPVGSSHGEFKGEDFFALGFWYEAIVLVTTSSHYAEDFVRHRCRLVARELTVLLPMLVPEPPAPADIRPVP